MGKCEERGNYLMEYVKCNLCGKDEIIPWGRKEGIDIVKCSGCGLIYCNPRPDDEELKKFYNDEYFSEGNYEEDVQRQKMYKIEIAEIIKNISQEGKFLDIGCAVGKFLHTLPDTFEKWGVEFSSEAAQIGREKFGLNITTGQIRNVDLPEEFFDIIQMRGVLEHSQNPFEDLSKMHSLLKNEGILRISQLPNIESICGKIFKTRFNQVKPGEHLYYFSPDTISEMLDKCGFEIVWKNYPYLGTPYESLWKDVFGVIKGPFNKKESPAFFRNMMILYAKKKEKTDGKEISKTG